MSKLWDNAKFEYYKSIDDQILGCRVVAAINKENYLGKDHAKFAIGRRCAVAQRMNRVYH